MTDGSGETRLRVLFVDDESSLTRPAEILLSRIGYQIEALTDAKKALQRFSENPQDYDAIVCDIYMPELSGLELALAARTIRQNIGVVLCSGLFSANQLVTARAAGIQEFVEKPYSAGDLDEALKRAVRDAQRQ